MTTNRQAAEGFPVVDYAAWRSRVEKELGERSFEEALGHHTRDGLALEPLYTAESLPPGFDPTRGTRPASGWRIGQEIACTSMAEAVAAMRADQQRGATLLWLRCDTVGVDLERLVAAVDPGTEVIFDFGQHVLEARHLAVELTGNFATDPLAELAAGRAPGSLDDAWQRMTDLAAWTSTEARGMRSVLVCTSPYHDAGATAVQELAFAVATGVEYLRGLIAAGLALEDAAAQLDFAFSIGRDVFEEIAKLRAARQLWSKVVRAWGSAEGARNDACSEAAQAMRLHARTSALETSRLDPWMNLVRGGAQTFVAAVGGADSITVAPHDRVLGGSEDAGRRLAVNVQHILSAEAHLGRVGDPAAGSWYLENLTDALARAAWERFRDLEKRGGMASCVLEGEVASRVEAAAERRRQAVAEGREAIVGASIFADPAAPEQPERPATDEDRSESPTSSSRLEPFRLAEPFEGQRAVRSVPR